MEKRKAEFKISVPLSINFREDYEWDEEKTDEELKEKVIDLIFKGLFDLDLKRLSVYKQKIFTAEELRKMAMPFGVE